MRQILFLLALTCAPAFCQDSTLSQQLEKNLRQNIGHVFNPQPVRNRLLSLSKLTEPPKIVELQSMQVCSIPLLNVKSAGNPVKMPGIRPEPQVFDHIAAKPPAPVCPAR